ncbi:MAG: MarR family transcriptional regulator [Verrucomicrobiales bacterium]|nr:MarR family transcriptional regulator [Verrucomicrobiales bacterium]
MRPEMLRKRAHLSKAEYEALASFRYALRKFLRFSEEKALAEGLPPQQHQALLAIKGFPGRDSVTIGELAERLQTEHHSAVGLADRLAKQGYLKRVRGTGDRRQVFVELTPRGEKVLAKLSMVHEDQLKQVGPEIAKLLCHLTEQDSKQSPKGKKPSSGRSPKPTKRS